MERSMALPRKTSFSQINFCLAVSWMVITINFGFVALYGAVGMVSADVLTTPKRTFDGRVSPAMVNLPYENVQFPSKDSAATIAAWYVPAAENTRAVILVHGRNASRTDLFQGKSADLIAALHQAGISVMSIDLRGHGQSSDGRFSYGLYERYDVLGAVDWLIARGYQPGKIGVMGLSLGASAVIGAAAEDPRIGALVSDSGFADIYPLIKSRWVLESGLPMFFLDSTRMMIQLKFGYDITSSKPVAEIDKVSPRPILLIHCTNDRLIPYSNVQLLQSAAPGAQLWTIPSCTHGQSYNADPVAYQEHLVNFYQSSLQ